jgi:hypothetical protein
MDEKDLAEIGARVEAATPGPWEAWVEGRDHTGGSSMIRTGLSAETSTDIEMTGATTEDYDFIANARQDVPALVAEIRRFQTLLND